MEGMLLTLGLLVCPLMMLALGGMAWVAARFRGGKPEDPNTTSARALLERRLAAGEIDVEEYYERESALRSAEVPARGRGGRRQ